MGIGHVAVALGASRAEPRVNVGVLVFAAFLADFLLGIFAAFGLERAHVPADYATRHYLTFTFPYSHGMVSLLLWGILLGILLCWLDRRNYKRAFVVIAALVFSHFILDGLVHAPELPLLGENSPKIGLALWNHMPIELTLETLMAVGGLAIYWTLAGSKVSRWGIAIYTLLLTALTWTQPLCDASSFSLAAGAHLDHRPAGVFPHSVSIRLEAFQGGTTRRCCGAKRLSFPSTCVLRPSI